MFAFASLVLAATVPAASSDALRSCAEINDCIDRAVPGIRAFAVSGTVISVAHPYFALEDKNNTIRMMNYSDVVTDMPLLPHEEQRITLFDNGGTLKFSTSQDNLYFIEADDNYIQVWYADSGGEIRQYMLRCRLKTVEESFSDSDLVRCHRKYIVNIGKVNILSSADKGYVLDLGLAGVDPIPVSRTYEQAVLARFNSRQ